MSKEAMLRVREVEVEAMASRQAAEKEAAARIEQNEKACAIREEKAIAATDEALKVKLETVKKRAEELIEQSRREAEDDVATLEIEARNRMRDAVKLIVWEMFDSCQ